MACNTSWGVNQSWRCELCVQFWAWVFLFLVAVCFSERTKYRASWHSLVWSLAKSSSRFPSCDNFSQSLNVLVFIVFHVTINNIFQGWFLTYSKCSVSLTQGRKTFCAFRFAKFYRLSRNFYAPFDSNVPSFLFRFQIHDWELSNTLLKFFFFIFSVSTVRLNKSGQTSKNFTQFLSFASFWRYAWLMK